MSERIISKEITGDAFINGTFSVIEVTDNELINKGDIYHKKSKIVFSKNPTQDISLLQTEGVLTYTNSSLLRPISSNSVDLSTAPGTPTYEMKTVFNSEKIGIPVSVLDIPLFYTASIGDSSARNVVFDSTKSLVGSPETNLSRLSCYNSFYMTYPDQEQGLLGKLLKPSLGIYERFMVLVGHYADAITTLNNAETFTIDFAIDNYNFPFPVDAYYLLTDHDKTLNYTALEQVLFSQIKKTISTQTLWYDNILSEDNTTSEYLFFRIEKWFSPTPVGTPDQVFFIPATDANKLFIDTQIVQNLHYSYRIRAYYAVIGQEYFFRDVVENVDGGECIVEVRPLINISSELIAEGMLINVPPPPVRPFVSFHNTASSKNKIKIYLELQKGQEVMFPVQISYQNNVLSSQFFNTDGQVEYSYMKTSARFQVYRVSEKPSSYDDFSESLIGAFENTDMTENMIVLDTVAPNKKYYYMFRAFNEYGSYSNPTPVYEVELIQDADESKISVNSMTIVDLNDEIPLVNNINFRSLLNLNVAEQQTNFVLSGLEDINGRVETYSNKINLITLGLDGNGIIENKIWGSKFKFRVKSNDSGKVIDFNVKVNLFKTLSEEEYELLYGPNDEPGEITILSNPLISGPI